MKTRLCPECDHRFVPDNAKARLAVCPFCGAESARRDKTRTALKDRCDRLFSRLARYCRADRDGYVHCCTCGKRKHWQAVDAGHYMSRKFLSTRWDWDNVWPQCKLCNSGFGVQKWKPDADVKMAYTTFLRITLGDHVPEQIHDKALHAENPKTKELQELVWSLEASCRAEGLDWS